MLADLHLHTTASDGQYPPAAVVEKAKARGLAALAITDHDTLDGVPEAISAGEAAGVWVIRGVELGAAEDRNLHILGYAYTPDAPGLRDLCETLRRSRDERKYRIVKFLADKGLDVPLSEVEALAGGQVIARPHFARAMVKLGYVSTTREAFDRYLDTEEYQKIERLKAPAKDCIAAIRQAGGSAVLAHPWQLRYENDRLEDLVARLKRQGLAGVECYYPLHTPEQTAFYLDLCEKYALHVTGGSDFHGERVKPDISIAAIDLDLNWLSSRKFLSH